MRGAASAGLAAALLAGPAAAAGESCAILGPLSVSAWLGVLSALGPGGQEAAGAALARMADVTAIHQRLGCDAAALAVATDCVTVSLTGPNDRLAPSAVAERCIAEAGIGE